MAVSASAAGYVRCNPGSGVECVPLGAACPQVDGGPDANIPDARPRDARADVPDGTAPDAGRDASAPDAH